jgi:hypothetical protein
MTGFIWLFDTARDCALQSTAGPPQSSVLAPTLHSPYINDALAAPGTHLALLVDNTCIHMTEKHECHTHCKLLPNKLQQLTGPAYKISALTAQKTPFLLTVISSPSYVQTRVPFLCCIQCNSWFAIVWRIPSLHVQPSAWTAQKTQFLRCCLCAAA